MRLRARVRVCDNLFAMTQQQASKKTKITRLAANGRAPRRPTIEEAARYAIKTHSKVLRELEKH